MDAGRRAVGPHHLEGARAHGRRDRRRLARHASPGGRRPRGGDPDAEAAPGAGER